MTSLSRSMLLSISTASMVLASSASMAEPPHMQPAQPQGVPHHEIRGEAYGHSNYHGIYGDHPTRPYYPHHYYPHPYYRPAPVYYTPAPVAYYPRPPRYYYSSYYTRRMIPVEPAYDYVEVRCGSAPITGTIVGGVTGGLIANQFARGHGDRGLATVGGALLGAIVGQSIDRANEHCAYQALEYGRPNTQVVWADPAANYSYTVTPGAIQRSEDGRYCREYQAKVLIDGQLQDGYGRACRQPDGSWETVN